MTSHSEIPEAAVEAAWDAFYASRESMEAALEAAAPHMLNLAKREAWDECEAAKYLVMVKADGCGLVRVKENPYR